MNFKAFRNKETGVVTNYPAHYENHPVYKDLLELVDEETVDQEFEEDKVVVDEAHELPVEQRAARVLTPKADAEATDETTDKE